MDFGSVTQTPFAYYDPDSSSWRTWEPFLFEDSTSFSGRWPKSGTTLGGHAFELPTSVLPTSAIACSSLPSPGTPQARDYKGVPGSRFNSKSLPRGVALLPTPRSQNGEDRNNKVWARPLDQPQNLENALARIGDLTPPPSDDHQH